MAEAALSFALEKVNSLLVGEGRLLGGIRREVEEIKDELESMRAFLRDADAREESDAGVKIWVKQVRDVSYDTEDILDKFMLWLAQERGFLGKSYHLLRHLKARHQIATQIKHIKARIQNISERSQRYHFDSSGEASTSNDTRNIWHNSRGDALVVEEADLVGITRPRDELIRLLFQEESRLGVVSVAGMGGLGKTTLVKKAYDDQRVKGHFQHHVWITVSESFQIEKILRDTIRQLFQEIKQPVPAEVDTMNDVDLRVRVKEFLQQKRYVIVLDDIWRSHAWEAVKHALPDSKCGSRVMVTTRSASVASSCIESYGHVYELKPLAQEEAWVLFCRKAFRSNGCPSELQVLSQNILRRCDGLPLAIVAIGGLLSTKDKTVMEWQRAHHSLGSGLESNEKLTSVMKILLLSYNDLPYHLKSCFLYVSIFPEDYLIERTRLIRVWMAEGFVQEQGHIAAEEVADHYLNELIDRSLIQAVEVSDYGRVRECRVHDLMREIIISKSREQNFATVVAEQNSKGLPQKIRRLSFHKSSNENIAQNLNISHTRSFVSFGLDTLTNGSVHAYFHRFMLLKVIDLRGAPLDVFPSEIEDLFHLRYLSLRRTNIKMIPKSIGKLQNLEILDLKHTYVSTLPPQILKLQKLHHLLVCRHEMEPYPLFDFQKGFNIPRGIGSLVSLQKLYFIEGNMISELGGLSQLRRLGITKLHSKDGKVLCASIEKMSNLLSLDIHAKNEEEPIDLESLFSPPLLLRRLFIHGRLEKVPPWISLLHNLVRICFGWSRFKGNPLEAPFEALEALPNLAQLSLYQAYDGTFLSFRVSGFQRLKRLDLHKLEQLTMVEVERGAMPCLEQLTIDRCQGLWMVPLGIEHLTNLKHLQLLDMLPQFTTTLLPEEQNVEKQGVDRWRVAGIPHVSFTYWNDGVWEFINL
ncbi:hypothetical protein HHK36_023204 [Tetracentron sinense]|uniref:Disease resistance protein RPM1-like n=1 Tax=Tetracentron sinense TaxID=13715 RepID=A0A834YMP2_TETSI|nr:hypothetical protein HHK36_023204 [Tetracentron sinense]